MIIEVSSLNISNKVMHMRLIILIVIIIGIFSCNDTKIPAHLVSSTTVQFEKLTFDQTLAKAKEMDKLVLVDVYSDG